MKQAELAKDLKIAQSTLSYWERGDFEPDNTSLVNLAEYFNVTTDYLLGRTDDPRPPRAQNQAPIDDAGLNPVLSGDLERQKKLKALYEKFDRVPTELLDSFINFVQSAIDLQGK
jgi:transcriptional regulator with XRE-family HTH domain